MGYGLRDKFIGSNNGHDNRQRPQTRAGVKNDRLGSDIYNASGRLRYAHNFSKVYDTLSATMLR